MTLGSNDDPDMVLAIPSKGSLFEGTLRFLSNAGLPVKYENERQYTGRLGSLTGIVVLFQRAEEIVVKVASGSVDLGITGEDLFREYADNSDDLLLVLKKLGYGHARLVVAVPNTWIDVASMEDLSELALSFRLKHHRNLKIATKFANLSRRFLSRHGIVDYSLVESLGATESAPSSGAADMIIDLTSSGRTLTDNNLKLVREGVIVSSEACLIASRAMTSWDRTRLDRFETLLDLLESYLRGRDTCTLQAAVDRSRIPELMSAATPGRLAYVLPTDEAQAVIQVSCPRASLHQTVRKLREFGAVEVIVGQPEYVFRHQSEAFQRVRHLLKKGSEVLEP